MPVPEGHTIHRIARDHQQCFVGQRLAVSSPQGRFQAEAKQLDGCLMKGVEAHGKHLFYQWARTTLHIHLGLYGKFRQHETPPPEPIGAVRLRVIGNDHAFDLNGPNRCELIDANGKKSILSRLGPDPLREDADREVVWQRISRSRAPIGTLLLDQSVLAGIGNVYRAEVLFILRMSPERLGNSLSREEFDQLWKTLVALMQFGVKYNRIITADPKIVGKSRGRMNRSERLLIYKKNHCPECGSSVQRWDLGSRTIYACSLCQV